MALATVVVWRWQRLPSNTRKYRLSKTKNGWILLIWEKKREIIQIKNVYAPSCIVDSGAREWQRTDIRPGQLRPTRIRADGIIAKFDSYLAKWCGAVRRVRLCSHKQRFVSVSYQLGWGEVHIVALYTNARELLHSIVRRCSVRIFFPYIYFHIFRLQIELKATAFMLGRLRFRLS